HDGDDERPQGEVGSSPQPSPGFHGLTLSQTRARRDGSETGLYFGGRMENLKKYRKSGLEAFIKFVRELPVIPPKRIFARLEELGYRGQEEARRAVSLMAYRHVKRIKRIYLEGAKREQVMPKANYLLIGPTGCGKTHLVELLFQHILKLPTVIVDITTYSETGYVGQDPNTIITRLLHAADENPLLASIGIICLDE